jgi:hypothetical protein
MTDRRQTRILCTRNWHEARSAAGRCHRCPRKVEELGWYCRRCRIEIAQQKAFLRIVKLLAEGRCTECGKSNPRRTWKCPACAPSKKVLNTRCSPVASLSRGEASDAVSCSLG